MSQDANVTLFTRRSNKVAKQSDVIPIKQHRSPDTQQTTGVSTGLRDKNNRMISIRSGFYLENNSSLLYKEKKGTSEMVITLFDK